MKGVRRSACLVDLCVRLTTIAVIMTGESSLLGTAWAFGVAAWLIGVDYTGRLLEKRRKRLLEETGGSR